MPSTRWSTSGLPWEEGMTPRLRNGNTRSPQPTTSPEHDQPPEAALSAELERATHPQGDAGIQGALVRSLFYLFIYFLFDGAKVF